MFGFHPANLALRFLLELAALVAIGVGAYSLAAGPMAWMLGIALPIVAATCWGVFNVPGDKSRSGEAPVAVRGVVRLAIELVFFASAVALISFEYPTAAAVLGVAVLVHYVLSMNRIRWLLAS